MKATEILAKSQAATASLIQKGTKGHKESIYKSEIFEGLSDKEKKSSRKKIRNLVQSMLSTICTAQEPALTKLITEFTGLCSKRLQLGFNLIWKYLRRNQGNAHTRTRHHQGILYP